MRPLGDKSNSNWQFRTRSGEGALQLLGVAKMKNGTNLIRQDGTFMDDSMISIHEFQTQAESFKVGNQMFDDYSDGFGSELDDGICDTQVLDGSEDTCQAQRGSLDGEPSVSNEHSDNNDTRLDDMEGSTQIVDDLEDMFRNQFANSGTVAEVNENMNCDENLCTEIINHLSEQLCTEGLVTTSDEQTALGNNGLCSSREVDHCKSSSDCLTDITLEHTSGIFVADAANNKDDTSGYVPPKFTEIRKESMLASAASGQSRLKTKNSELDCSTSTNTNQSSRKQDEKGSSKSGYVPPRFTEIPVEAWLEYGLEVKRRALSGNTAGTFCSVGTIPAKQKLVDKENRMLVKGSPSNWEGTDDEDFTAFNEPKDGRKVKSSAVRKLFAEELGSHTEGTCGIISTGNDESEPPVGEGDTNAAGLSYIYSQEPNDIEHANALDFVEKFLTENLMDIVTNDSGGTRVKKTNAVAHSNCKQSSKKSILRNFVGFSKAFDWDDDNEDEGGGALFCKLKEKTFKKESNFVKPAPLIQKFNANGKKRNLSYSEKKFVSQNMKRTAKNIEENAKENVINVRNRDCAGNIASHQNTLAMIIACKDVSACTSAVTESYAGRDTYLLNSKEIGPSEVVSIGQTRRGSYIKVLKRARPTSDKASDNSVPSMQIPTGWGKGMSQDAPTHNQDAKLIEQAMEVSACAGKTTRSGNGHIPTVLGSKGGSSGNYPGQKGQVDQVKPTQSKAKASSKSNSCQSHQMLNKNAIPRRSCRSNKVMKLEDSHKQQLSRIPNDSTLEHSGLTKDKEVMHLPFQVDASLEVLNSEYSLKRLTWRSAWSSEQKGKKRVFPNSELTSGESTPHEITNETTSNLKINGSKSIHDDRKSYRNNKNQGKNSRIMTCIRQTRGASLQRSQDTAETVHDDFVEPIEQPLDFGHAKRTRTTSCVGHDPVAVNSRDTSIKVTNNQICQVQPVKHQMQFEPTSRNKIVGEPISSNQQRIPLRKSRRLNGSSTLEDLSLQNVNKQANAGATEDQFSLTDFGTSAKDTLHKVETSPRGKTYIPCMNCVTPANAIKQFEEASPICMGNEYYISCKQIPSGSNLKKEVSKLATLSPKLTSGKKDYRKWRVMTDVRVLFSRHLDENILKQQKKILYQLGASLASSLSDATHFIADKFVRTKNMLEAIALGKPVLTPVWLVSCCETKTHIDEKNYILRDVKQEKEFGFSMPVSLDSALRQPLLQKRRVFITLNTKPGKEVIACLVKAVGGQVVGRITGSALRYHNTRDSLLILTCEEDYAICAPFMEKGSKVYSSELLLNGIVTQRLDYERYRLFDDDRRRITTGDDGK